MIKKSVFEDEIIAGMEKELVYSSSFKQGTSNLSKAAEYLHAALEIFEESGMTSKADQILEIFRKIANKHLGENKPKHPKNPTKINSPTSEQQIKNLLHHGTVFNMDKMNDNDVLDLDIAEDNDDLVIHEHDPEKTFED